MTRRCSPPLSLSLYLFKILNCFNIWQIFSLIYVPTSKITWQYYCMIRLQEGKSVPTVKSGFGIWGKIAKKCEEFHDRLSEEVTQKGSDHYMDPDLTNKWLDASFFVWFKNLQIWTAFSKRQNRMNASGQLLLLKTTKLRKGWLHFSSFCKVIFCLFLGICFTYVLSILKSAYYASAGPVAVLS